MLGPGVCSFRFSLTDDRPAGGSLAPCSKETPVLFKSKDEATGKSLVNQYLILDELGRGQHGKVRLARDVNDGTYWVRRLSAARIMFASSSRANNQRAPLLSSTFTFAGDQDHKPQSQKEALGILFIRSRPARVSPSPEGEQVRRRPARRLARDLPERFYRPLTFTRLLSRLRKEIAILKKLRHEHVVRLREVIDAPSSKYIFLGELRIVMRRLSWLRLT